MLNSLLARLMMFSSLALLLVLTIIGIMLDKTFYDTELKSLQENLKLYNYSILSTASVKEQRPILPVNLLEENFNQPKTKTTIPTHYAQLINHNYELVWHSISASDLSLPKSAWAEKGQWIYTIVKQKNSRYLLGRYGVSWSKEKSAPVYNMLLLVGLEEFQQKILDYRKVLALLLLVVIIFLLTLLYVVLRWGLAPLNKISADLRAIQQGAEISTEVEYPKELRPLTKNLFDLIESERKQRQRYRNTLHDLSHSLKTPLTVMSSILQAQKSSPEPLHELQALQLQIDKMKTTIDYQLQRAVSGSAVMNQQEIAILEILQPICSAMDKVYATKNIIIHIDVAEELSFSGDENDLLEVLGNLIDNACKYSQQQIEISAKKTVDELHLYVCDDGPGLNSSQLDIILQRGQRLDTMASGQGLGLSLVKDIIDVYQANIEVAQSKNLSGACFHLTFPINNN